MTVTERTQAGNSTVRLSCRDVSVRFGGLMAVNQVSISVPAAGIVGLVGPNGAGKSTLFGVLSGILPPTRGRVFLNGEDITSTSPQQRAALGLARTFQHPELFTGLTVRDHLVLAHRARHEKSRVWTDLFSAGSLRRPGSVETEQVDGLIEMLGLIPLASRPAAGLPLGVARLIELGRALATDPKVLLLDEPSSGLDSAASEQFESTLARLAQERDISVLLVEHDVEMVMRMCTTVNVLDFGSCIASGTPQQIRSDARVRAAYLGESVGEAVDPVTSREIDLRSIGRGAELAPTGDARAGTPAVAVEGLSIHYGDALALSGLTFELAPGRALAVLGPNGAGKSSLARALSGLVPPSSGTISLDGQRIERWAPHRIRQAGLIHLPEGRGVFRNLSVLDNVRMAARTGSGRAGRRQAVERAFATFPILADRRHLMAGSLSGGEQQMLSLARALATSPKVIVADEMSLGLAPIIVDLVFEGLQAARAAGATVIMIEQYVHRALAFAEHCIVLNRGRLAWSGPATDAGPELLAQYLGTALTAS